LCYDEKSERNHRAIVCRCDVDWSLLDTSASQPPTLWMATDVCCPASGLCKTGASATGIPAAVLLVSAVPASLQDVLLLPVPDPLQDVLLSSVPDLLLLPLPPLASPSWSSGLDQVGRRVDSRESRSGQGLSLLAAPSHSCRRAASGSMRAALREGR